MPADCPADAGEIAGVRRTATVIEQIREITVALLDHILRKSADEIGK